jgi:hypothetical protein
MISLLISSAPSSTPATTISFLEKKKKKPNRNMIISGRVTLPTYLNKYNNSDRRGPQMQSEFEISAPAGNQTLCHADCSLKVTGQPHHRFFVRLSITELNIPLLLLHLKLAYDNFILHCSLQSPCCCVREPHFSHTTLTKHGSPNALR